MLTTLALPLSPLGTRLMSTVPGRAPGVTSRALMAVGSRAFTLSSRLVAEIPSPTGSSAPPGVGTKLNTILAWSAYIAFGMCVLGMIASGGLMAIAHRRGQSGEHIAGIGYALGGSVVIGAAGALIKIFAS